MTEYVSRVISQTQIDWTGLKLRDVRFLSSVLAKKAYITLFQVKSRLKSLLLSFLPKTYKSFHPEELIVAIVSFLATHLDIPEDQVESIVQRAPLLYKVYKIPKRSFGTRTIAQPTPELKKLQRAFLLTKPLPVHSAAMAYQPSLSIKKNALHHLHNQYLLKLDLLNFFNSITPDILWQEWKQHFEIPPPKEKKHIENLLFWAPQRKPNTHLILSVGAPSSPNLSNFILYRFDERLQNLCKKLNITYTRYADDLTFSTNTRYALFSIPEQVAMLLNELFTGRININKRKTIFTSKAHNRHVTGVGLSSENKLSLGRAKKRYLKHLVHQFTLSLLADEEISHLQGWLAHAKHIEPTFIESLTNKYGKDIIHKIFETNHD